jgi:hypothetical protein
MLRQKLKESQKSDSNKNNRRGEDILAFPPFFGLLPNNTNQTNVS